MTGGVMAAAANPVIPATPQLRGKPAWLPLCLVLAASLIYLAVMLSYARQRPMDRDEGYYPTAGRLVAEGGIPYHDFAYPQGPAMPYIYSVVWRLGGHSLVAFRSLSAVLGALAAFLWGVFLIRSRVLPLGIALGTFLAILLNPYWISWNVVVKTFAAANFLMTVAMISLYNAMRSDSGKWYGTAGFAIGLTGSIRSLYTPLVPVFVLWFLWRRRNVSDSWLSRLTWFIAGAACGLVPLMASFAIDPQAFIFNNLRYRPLLSPHPGLRASLRVVLSTANILLHEYHFVAMILLAMLGAWGLWRMRASGSTPYSPRNYEYFRIAIVMVAVYTVMALIPYPVYEQYFTSPLLPFLVLFIAEGLRTLWGYTGKAMFLLPLIAAFLCVLETNRIVHAYSSVPYLRVSSYESVARLIQDHSRPDETVLAFWPGYIFESARRYFPGAEDHFNFPVAKVISPEARARFHVASKDEIIAAVSAGVPDLLVLDPFIAPTFSIDSPADLQAFHDAVARNYREVGKIDSVTVYRTRRN